MRQSKRVDIRQALLHGAVGALGGATFVALFLAFDILGSGFVLDWAQGSVVHAVALVYKPMMLCFTAALGWSAWRQLEAQVETARRPARRAAYGRGYAVSRG